MWLLLSVLLTGKVQGIALAMVFAPVALRRRRRQGRRFVDPESAKAGREAEHVHIRRSRPTVIPPAARDLRRREKLWRGAAPSMQAVFVWRVPPRTPPEL